MLKTPACAGTACLAVTDAGVVAPELKQPQFYPGVEEPDVAGKPELNNPQAVGTGVQAAEPGLVAGQPDPGRLLRRWLPNPMLPRPMLFELMLLPALPTR